TSGSTGRPKGVVVEHRSLTNVVYAQVRTFAISSGDRVLQFVAPHFDAAQAEVFRTLAAGATLCMASTEDLLPGPPLAAVIHDGAITLAALPPTALAALPAEDFPALGILVIAGEACPAALADRWRKPGRQLFNSYGPTEATVCATLASEWKL